jgi:filamentous hemagglutinin
MNKNFHRVIWSAARAMRVVTQETANSTGRGSSKATGGSSATAPIAKTTAAAVALFGVLVALPGQAQIVANPFAPGGMRPTILVAPNGVPIANIATPSAAGVSRNQFLQFDINARGVVVNNSRVNAQSGIGGWIVGNPNLATGPARVILSEVNSSNPSYINGPVEIAGSRAEFILANPSGIAVSGGTFVNASRVTLTTGTPQFNAFGGLDSYVVRGGTVSINGAGLDLSKTDYAAILARAVQVNAAINANDLKVVTGANQISADHSQITPTTGTGVAPTFALDVAALGGMYANKITMIGTEAGLGVRNAGSLGASNGNLIVTSAGRLENTGTLEGTRVELASAGDIDNRNGTIRQTSSVGLTITAPTLSNSNGGVIGVEPVAAPTAGAAGAGGASTGGTTSPSTPAAGTGFSPTSSGAAAPVPAPFVPVSPGTITAAGSILNDGGRIYSGGPITLQSANIKNNGGTLSVASMTVNQPSFSNQGGTLNVSNGFNANVGSFDNTGGKLNAGSLSIATSGDLINTDGTLTSATDASLTVGGKVENTRGTIAATGALTVNVVGATINSAGTLASNQGLALNTASLQNTQGNIQSAQAGVQLAVTNELVNGSGGAINAATDLNVQAAALSNSGSLRAGSDASVAVGGALTSERSITAGRHLTVAAGSVQSGSTSVFGAGVQADGQLGGAGDLRVTSSGALVASGTNLAAGNATLQGASVDLSSSKTSAANIALTATQGNVTTSYAKVTTPGTLAVKAAGAVTNIQGTLAADGTTTVDAASLDSTGGTVAAVKGDLNVTTTGRTVNDGGTLQAGGKTTLSNGGMSNVAGKVFGQSTVAINTNGATYDNSGGLTQAVGDLGINAGDIQNAGGLIRSLATTTLNAATIGNTNTQSKDQGIEGKNVDLAVGNLTNDTGAIRADVNARITSGGTVSNVNGLISAGNKLSIVDPSAANPAAKTLSVVNTGGTLIAGTAAVRGADGKVQTAALGKLEIDAKDFSGDGTTVGVNDLRIALAKDVTNNVDVKAGGNLTYATTGKLTNYGKLLAGGTVTASGNEVDNKANAEISGANTIVNASGTLTNRGLIDSQGNTQINATTVNNVGTGRIYGDIVSVAASSTLNNVSETVDGVTKAGTIAARDTLDIGAQTINNREHALLFSVGEMSIGKALDANRYAIGKGGTLNNESASIESLGAMSIAMDNINNVDTRLKVATSSATATVLKIVTMDGKAWDPLDAVGNPVTWGDPGTRLVYHKAADGTVSVIGKGWTNTATSFAVTEDSIAVGTADPARIVSGGDMTLDGHLYNRDSKVIAGGELNAPDVDNQATWGKRNTAMSARWVGYNPNRPGKSPEDPVDFPPTMSTDTYKLTDYKPLAHQNATQGYNAGVAGRTSVSDAAGGQQGSILEIPSNVNGRAGTGGTASQPLPMVVRTSVPNVTVPQASLFGLNGGPGGRYLIETDPRFANYRQWLSSDYLLSSLGQDPNNILKRLGDGFYEQKLIREQVAQLTGYRYLGGYSSDEDQYIALMNAGATFAKEYGLRPGIGLSAAQMAQLTSDIVWLVEQTVTLPDGSTQQVLVPQVYVRVRPGDIDGNGAVLSADKLKIKGGGDLVNTGTIAGRTLVKIDTDNIDNLGGRISGGNVELTAKTDLNNIGGTIDAANRLKIEAGRDVNVRSTTQANGWNTNVDRIAGLYVTNPGGTLIAGAGHDVNLIGGIISNQGKGGYTSITAKNDINLGTVTETRAIVGIGKSASMASASSQELGSTITTNGTTVLKADQDVNARQATVNAGEGLLSVHADRDVNIESGQSRVAGKFSAQWQDKSTFKRTDNKLSGSFDSSTSVGSSFTGGVVAIDAGENLNIEGARIAGRDGVALHGGNSVNIYEARNTSNASVEFDKKTSGLNFNPTLGALIGPRASGITVELKNDVAAPASISSEKGGVLIEGGVVNLRGVQVDAAKDIKIEGTDVNIAAAENRREVNGTETSRGGSFNALGFHSFGKGINAKLADKMESSSTTLTNTTLSGANVNIAANGLPDSAGGTLNLAGTTVNTPGTLTLKGDQVNLLPQRTETSMRNTSQGGDVAWQKTTDKGTTDQKLNYNQLNVGKLVIDANHIQAGLGARDSVEALGKQPGMDWVNQLQNDPKLKDKVDWVKVEEAHKNWNYRQQGLTPAAAAVVTIVVAYFTAGAASGLGEAAGSTLGAANTVVMADGVLFTGVGLSTSGAIISGAVTAGIAALAAQTAVALINHQGDIGGALHDLGSSASVKNLLTAIITGGVLGGLDLNPTGLPTAGGGSQPFFTQLGQNLQAGAARALISTAINGGSFEESLKNGLKNAILDTIAAQAANEIGDLTKKNGVLNDFTNKVAHAIAGCMVGAARADSSSGCGAGALGAVVGEMAAEAYGRQADTTQFAAMIAGLAVAITGGDAALINLGSQAGSNAAANNYLFHDEAAMRDRLQQEKAACQTQACKDDKQAQINAWNAVDRSRDRDLKSACTNPAAKDVCAGLYADLQAASASYDPTRGNPQVPTSVRAEGESIRADLREYAFAQAYPKTYGALTAGVNTVEGVAGAPVLISMLAIGAASGDSSAWKALADIAVSAAVVVTDLPAAVSAKLDEANLAEEAGNTTKATQIRAQLVLDGTLGVIGTSSLLKAMGWTGLATRPMLRPIAAVADFDGGKIPTYAADPKYAYIRDTNLESTGGNLETAALQLVKDEVGSDFIAAFDTKIGKNGLDLGYAKMIDGEPRLVIGEGKASDKPLSAFGENLQRTLDRNLAKLKTSIQESNIESGIKTELLEQLDKRTYQIELYAGSADAARKMAARFDDTLIQRLGGRPTRVIQFSQPSN